MKRGQFNAVTVGIFWIVSLGMVFVLGILSAFAFHLGPGAAGLNTENLTLEQRDLAIILERYTGQPANLVEIMAVGDNNEVPEQLEQALRAILRESDPEIRQMSAFRLVGGLPSRRVMSCIRLLQEIRSSPARDQVLGCFLESWAENDGRSAIAFATSLASSHERELAIQAVLRGWSVSRPADAWNWVVERVGASRRAERWLEVILSRLGSYDRATALNLLERMPDSEFQERMSLILMDQILQTESPREAMNWLSELPGTSTEAAAAHLAGVWAQTEPEASAVWLAESFPGELEGLGDVLREWVYRDPEGAVNWVWSNLTGGILGEMMSIVAEEWIANDGPTPLAEWLNDIGTSRDLDGAIEQLALATAGVEPATALVWAQSVSDPDTRSVLEIMIGREWIRRDPDQAAESLPLLLESESARAALLGEGYYSGEMDFEEETAPGPVQ